MQLSTVVQNFRLQVPIGEGGIFWNGKPDRWSNMPKYNCYMSQRYGMQLLDYTQFGLESHNGTDIAGAKLTPIVAPCRMWTSYVRDDATGYGRQIRGETETKKVNGDNVKLEIVFGHFELITIKAYRWFDPGTVIGGMGTTGFSTGVHLHFGVRPLVQHDQMGAWEWVDNNKNAGYVDPELFLNTKLIWDYSELMPNNNIEKFLKEHDTKLIRNGDTGEFGWVYANMVHLAPTKSRATLLNRAVLHRRDGGVTVQNDFWVQLPKTNF